MSSFINKYKKMSPWTLLMVLLILLFQNCDKGLQSESDVGGQSELSSQVDSPDSPDVPDTPDTNPEPGAGGTGNGQILLRETFAQNHNLITWGDPEPNIISDATALDGKALRYQWQSGYENYNGAFAPISGVRKKIHVRIRYKQGANAQNGGIQKVIRIRANSDGSSERAVGTINSQYNTWLFNGDDFGDGDNHVQQSNTIATHGPDTFRNRWRYLELMLDYTDLTKQKAKLWVDGVLILDSTVNLSSAIYSNVNLNGVMLLGTFNSPADTRSDWVDELVVSTDYIGL